MKVPSVLLASAALLAPVALAGYSGCDDVRDEFVQRDGCRLTLGGKPWKAVGANVYWLGLDENIVPPPKGEPWYPPQNSSYPTRGRITEIMEIVKAMGGTMIRAHTLGANQGNPLTILPKPHEINEDAFETIDWAVHQAREYGLRLMIPLVDNYDYYHGGKYNFLRWHGYNLKFPADAEDPLVNKFFTDKAIVSNFHWFVRKLLTHRNPLTGLTYAEDPTVFAWETGNELYGDDKAAMNVPVSWLRSTARLLKKLSPDSLVVDGTYGINAEHLAVDEVDVFSDHFYPLNVTKLREGVRLAEGAGRGYFAGEYDWTGLNGGDDLKDWYGVLEKSEAAVGDTFWSLFGRNVPNCNQWVNHSDGFTVSYRNPENTPKSVKQMELIRQHLMKQGQGKNIGPHKPLPAIRCPAQ